MLKTKWIILDLEIINKLNYKIYILFNTRNKINLTI